MLRSKLTGMYKDNKKLIIDVHNADFLAAKEFSSFTEISTKKTPISGISINNGRIGTLNILE